MAFGGNQNVNMIKKLENVFEREVDKKIETSEETVHEDTKTRDDQSYKSVQNAEMDQLSSNKNSEEPLSCEFEDMKLSEFVGTNVSDRNTDESNLSSDSLSSSASLSDSDLTSTDSEDSLALSESESITDVTPLNSPYCDSPLPQSRNFDLKSDDRNFSNPCKTYDYDGSADNCHRPEVNVLMKAIEKLEATHSSEFDFRETMMRRRAASLSIDESKKIELENQRLFKRVISKQNRMRSMYPASNLPPSKSPTCKQESVKSDGDISGATKKCAIAKLPKQADKSQSRRRQKCLSHPSCANTLGHVTEKRLLTDACKDSGKKKHGNVSSVKSATPQTTENSCEGTVEKSVVTKSTEKK